MMYSSSNKWIIGQNIANNTFNWTKLAKFMLSPTECITCSKYPRVQNKKNQSQCLDFIQDKKYLHCTTKPEF